tara:strand:+ start:1864 stop:3396 length:1533 start_codon:yes stop_codon:yes gene_type:complete
MSDDEMELNYRQVTSNRPLNNGQFPQGVIDYDWNIGGKTGWIPNKTYFRVALQISGAAVAPVAGVPQPNADPLLKDQIAIAESVCGNLSTSVNFKAGGQDVSSIVNFVPQAQACKTRLTKSGAWLNSVGKTSYLLEPDFQKRVNNTASDVPSLMDVNQQTVKLGDTNANQHLYQVAIALDGVVVGTNTAFQTAGVVVGDELLVNGQTFTVVVVGANPETQLTVSPAPAVVVNTGATGSALKLLREQDGAGRPIVYAIWQPPIGIFDHHRTMGSGAYTLTINPNAFYKTSCVQSKIAGLLAPAHFDFNVLEIMLFVATAKVDLPATGVETITLMEHQVLSKTIDQLNGDNLLDFTVPSSTKAISVFVQSGDAGTNTQITPNMFKTKNGSDANLVSIQLSYANTVKPSTRWTSAFGDRTNYLVQRYTDTQLESGKIYSEGGCESFGDWLKRGPLIHYSFDRDKNDRSTMLQVSVQYTGLEQNANLFVVAHYRKVTDISITNGFVTSVNSLAI